MAPTPSQLKDWDRQVVWHAFTQMQEYEPRIIERAEGCYLVDLEGKRYLDGVSSLWCNVHGHCHPRLDRALQEQISKVAHVTSLGLSNPSTIELAHRLTELAGLSHVFFSSDGSSAVEVALKMAFQYWRQRDDPQPQKNRYVAFGDAYHGDTLGSVSVGGVARFHEMFEPLLFEVIRLPAPATYPVPAGVSDEAALCRQYLAQLRQLLEDQHDEISAVVIEPLVQCAAGMRTHPAGYLSGVRELTREFGVLLIADEVAVGFGRTGRMFACEHENVVPDFLCLGKGLTGGYLPMAATVTHDEIWNAFLGEYTESKTFFHGHTYGGNPLAAAVSLANLDIFAEERTLERLVPRMEQLQVFLDKMAEHPHVGDVRRRGMIAGIELVQNRESLQPFPWSEQRGMRVCEEALARGVWLRPLGNVIVIMPPLSIDGDELDLICEAVAAGIDVATR